MLRDFQYDPRKVLIKDILFRFEVEIGHDAPLSLLRFELLTPDSFMWRLLISDSVYYLYAEDFVPGLQHVKDVFNAYLENDQWSFVKVTHPIPFLSSTPVKHADVYSKLETSDDMMDYAADSGYDFVFLVKSSEDANWSSFSRSAPRGFKF